METETNVGSIIQVRPNDELDNCWKSVLMVVGEVKTWGVVAFVLTPAVGAKNVPPGRFYMRLKRGQYDVVGAVKYLPGDLWDKLPPLEAILFTPVNVRGS